MHEELSMERIRERLDELEKLCQDSEGDADRVGLYWNELKHLRQVYDRMVMDSQGQGIQMMQDIMEKTPTTRDNYSDGVPVATTESPIAATSAQPASSAPVNLTINVMPSKEEVMEPSFDDRVVALARSDRAGADIRMPVDTRNIIEKAKKPSSSVDEVDTEKIRQMHEESDKKKDDKKKKPEEGDEKPDEGEDSEKSFYRAETETLQKAMLACRMPMSLFRIGIWSHRVIQASKPMAAIAKAVSGFMKSHASPSLLAGIKARAGEGGVAPVAGDYAKVVACNAEIQSLQEKVQGCNDPDESIKLDQKLRTLYEKLAFLVMNSAGLGVQTEDMIRNEPDTRFDKEVTTPVVGVAKSQGLEKSSGHKTGCVGKLKYALTYWDAEGGLSAEQADAVVHEIASTDKAVAKRLGSKLPPLKRMREGPLVVSLNGSDGADAPIKGKKGNQGKHLGQLKHVVGGQGKGKK